MDVETTIKLDKIKLRDYQLPILDAFENKGYRNILVILPRRAGKDLTSLWLALRHAIKRPMIIYMIYPTYNHGRRILWDGITSKGMRFIDMIPEELVESKNSTMMKIILKNGSIIQLIGSDKPDTIIGTNPSLCIFSEYAVQDPRVYHLARPILDENGGSAIFISTPRGKNHFWEMYNRALNRSDWFVYKLTVEDTNHISMKEIERTRREGELSEDMIQQEYFCSFELGVEGAFYTKYLDRMHLNGQIGVIPWDSSFQVHTAWDLGMRDSSVIIFFQICGQIIRVIDFYQNSKEGLEHYISVVKNKPYVYGKHLAPHDIKVRELTTAMTRIDKARELGIEFTVVPNIPLMDGIEAVRSKFSQMWIDENNCKDLIRSLENYRQEYDPKKADYNDRPLHNWASHAADAARYMCVGLSKIGRDITAEDIKKAYIKSRLGSNNNSVFNDNNSNGYS